MTGRQKEERKPFDESPVLRGELQVFAMLLERICDLSPPIPILKLSHTLVIH
jgi:hypothetical protein